MAIFGFKGKPPRLTPKPVPCTLNSMSYHLYAREYGGHIEWVYCYDTKREAEYARQYNQETYPDFAGFPVSYFVSTEAPEPLISCDQWEAAGL
jgi:hypothetical protein